MKILYNPQFHRWEVYGKYPIIRNGEPQPCFVSKTLEECERYVRDVA